MMRIAGGVPGKARQELAAWPGLLQSVRMTNYPGPSGAALIEAIAGAGVRFVAALPDIVTSDGLLWPISRDARFRLIRLCKEDEGVAICAGLAFTGQRAVLLMQQTGLVDSLNAIRAIAVEYRQPICMVVGMQGKEAEVRSAASSRYGVRIVPAILDAMGIEHFDIEGPGDEAALGPAIARAYELERPFVALVGRAVAR
jgi:sulfopyruvate decarboxylase subunit beta